MAGETTLTIIGNLTADPEMRNTQGGGTVCSFTVASTPRVYNRQSGQYEDGPALFLRCAAWRDLAQHCAQTLAKGMRVIASGQLKPNNYTDQQGQKHYGVQLVLDEIGPSLRFATATVNRIQQGQGFQGGQSAYQGGQTYGQPQDTGQDPWSNNI